jgi:hypothetical protein
LVLASKCTYKKDNGIYYSTYGGLLQRSVVPPSAFDQLDDVLSYDYVRGVSHYQNWSMLEIADGVFNWTVLDNIFNSAATHGKHVLLGLQMGVCAPAWLLSKCDVETVRFVHGNPGWRSWSTVQSYDKGYLVSTMAVPWQTRYESFKKRAVAALASRYANRSQLTWVNVCGPSVSGGVEANFNVDYAASRQVNALYDTQMNYTQRNYVDGWQRMIDFYIGLFKRSGMATHDQCGDEGWENGTVTQYTTTQKLASARAIRDYLIAQHTLRKGAKPVVRCCGGNSDTRIWGVPGSDPPSGPPSNYARLMWEIRETADVGFEPNGLGGKPYTPTNRNQQVQQVRKHIAAENTAGMQQMLGIEVFYNGRYLEIKRPDLITNRNIPNISYAGMLANTSAAMTPGRQLPWDCP